jgi:uncharacterized membrane protein SpoIIM required for sporulation
MWNASVIATALGDFIRMSLSKSNILFAVGSAFITYALHGILEISAYFIGGLAGGIISIAVIRHHYKTKKFYYVMKDATYLVLISFGLLIVAAIVEVFLRRVI